VISDRFPKGAFSEGRPGFSFQYTSGAAPAENLVAALADLRGAKEISARGLSPYFGGA